MTFAAWERLLRSLHPVNPLRERQRRFIGKGFLMEHTEKSLQQAQDGDIPEVQPDDQHMDRPSQAEGERDKQVSTNQDAAEGRQ